jgi:hypothetical protein
MNQKQLEDRELAEQMRAAQAGDAEAYAAVLKAITPKVRQIIQKERGSCSRRTLKTSCKTSCCPCMPSGALTIPHVRPCHGS